MNEAENTQEQEIIEQGEPSAETQKTEEEQRIPKSRFDQVNEERKALKAELERYQKAQAELELRSKEEQGKFRELYEATKDELSKERERISKLEFDMLRKEVAAKSGYPDLWGRLQGGNREELESDMAALLEAMPRPAAPSVNGAAGTGERKPQAGKMTAEEKKEFATVFGLRVEDLPEL